MSYIRQQILTRKQLKVCQLINMNGSYSVHIHGNYCPQMLINCNAIIIYGIKLVFVRVLVKHDKIRMRDLRIRIWLWEDKKDDWTIAFWYACCFTSSKMYWKARSTFRSKFLLMYVDTPTLQTIWVTTPALTT